MKLYTAFIGWMKPQHDRHQTVGIYANIITGRKAAISVTQTHTHNTDLSRLPGHDHRHPLLTVCMLNHYRTSAVLLGNPASSSVWGVGTRFTYSPNSKTTKTPPTTTAVSDWSLHNTRSSRSSPIDRLPASVPCVGWLAGGRTRMTGLSRFQLGTIEDSSLD